MKNFRIGALLLTLVAVFTVVSPFVFDWNATHIYNPRWTPHAKFHNAQTMLLAVFLGFSTLYFTWRTARATAERRLQLKAAILFALAYWVTQILGVTFPGTALLDPEFVASNPTVQSFTIPIQPIVDVVIFVLLGIAYYLENRRINEQNSATENL